MNELSVKLKLLYKYKRCGSDNALLSHKQLIAIIL